MPLNFFAAVRNHSFLFFPFLFFLLLYSALPHNQQPEYYLIRTCVLPALLLSMSQNPSPFSRKTSREVSILFVFGVKEHRAPPYSLRHIALCSFQVFFLKAFSDSSAHLFFRRFSWKLLSLLPHSLPCKSAPFPSFASFATSKPQTQIALPRGSDSFPSIFSSSSHNLQSRPDASLTLLSGFYWQPVSPKSVQHNTLRTPFLVPLESSRYTLHSFRDFASQNRWSFVFLTTLP